MRVVAEHVEARARRRQQHGVARRAPRAPPPAPPAAASRRSRACTPRRAPRASAAHRARSAPCGAPCRGTPRRAGVKSWFLPSPPAIITSGPGHAGDRGERRADVGALGVIDVGDAVDVRHPLRAVRQAGEARELGEHRRQRQRRAPRRAPARRARWRRCAHRGSCSCATGSSGVAARVSHHSLRVHGERVVGADAGAQREAERARRGARHRRHQRIVEVDDRGVAAREDARLGRRVARERGVAVEMIGR